MLLKQFQENRNLRFLDAETSTEYSLSDFLQPLPDAVSVDSKLIFLYLDNSIQSIGLYLNLLGTTNVLALLNRDMNEDFKKKLEAHYQPQIIYDNSRTAITDFTGVKTAIAKKEITLFTANLSSKTTLHPNIKIVLSTSGSTGSPKFVKLSEENLLENAISISDYLPIVEDDVTPLNLPIFYSYGLSVLHSNALSGGTIVCGLQDIMQRTFWDDCQELGFTSIAGVPFLYEMLDRIGFRKKSYPSLRYMTQAGGNLNLKTKRRFVDFCAENNISYYVMYGQTEATARISFVPPQQLNDKITSIGIPIKNGALGIDPATDELIYSGPNVFGGYATTTKELESWENKKELRTGDLAKKDKDGFVYIIGRMKRFVKMYGIRINLDELEKYLKNSLAHTSLATNGIEDKIVLISYSGALDDEAAVKKMIFEKFKIHPTGIKFQQLEELPLTSNGKVNYKQLIASYGV